MAEAKVERLRVQVLCLTVAVITLPAVWMWTQSGAAHSSSLFGVALGIVFFNPWLLETT